MTDDRKIRPDQLVLNIHDLPSIPAIAADALRVVSDDKASSADIECVVGRDQALTAKVLKVTNSAAYGFRRRVETVREAVVMVGTRKMKDIAASMVAAEMFKSNAAGLVDAERLWAHALATSVWAREIIEQKKLWAADAAVTASLLHDLGILILSQFAEERYQPVLEESRSQHIHHVELELQKLGTTHARIGATLCAKWCLPVSVTQLVSHHHSHSCPADEVRGIVVLADYLADETGNGPFEWGPGSELPEGLLEMMHVTPADFDVLLSRQQAIEDQTAALRDAM